MPSTTDNATWYRTTSNYYDVAVDVLLRSTKALNTVLSRQKDTVLVFVSSVRLLPSY